MVDVPSMKEFQDLVMRVNALEQGGCPPQQESDDYTDRALWEMIFNEEFLGTNLDIWRYWESAPTGRWKTFFYFGDRVLNSNGERQYYFDEYYKGNGQYQGGKPLGINPFDFDNGVLKISAAKSDPAKTQYYWGYPYTSGLITTEMSHWQKYGRFTARIRFPAGKGLWPAFWLLPKDKSWPPEMDSVEFFGGPNSRGEGGVNQMHWGLHSTQEGAGTGGWVAMPFDLTADFHVYAIEWTEHGIRYFVDDDLIAEVPTPSDCHKDFYMLVNLAVGGSWPEMPDKNTVFPAVMEVDFVRAYKAR